MGAPLRCLDELWVFKYPHAISKLTGDSDVFMDSVNRDVSMKMIVGLDMKEVPTCANAVTRSRRRNVLRGGSTSLSLQTR